MKYSKKNQLFLSSLFASLLLAGICNTASAAVLFSDNFNDGNLDGWTFQTLPGDGSNFVPETVNFIGGNGVLEMNSIRNENNRIGMVMPGASYSDYTVSSRIQFVSNTGGTGPTDGIIGRAQNSGSFYDFSVAGVNNNEAVLRRFVNGTQNVLATYDLSSPIGLGNWYDLSMNFSGNRIRTYLNGDLIFNLTDSAYSSGGFGVHTAARKSYYDNFSVKTLSTGNDLPPEPRQEPTPTLNSNNLVFYTHGWNTSQNTWDNGIWSEMGDALRGAVDGNEWQVFGADWTEISSGLRGGPVQAVNRARELGEAYGKVMADKNYDQIHLIAHSAGSQFITTAASMVKEFSPQTKIHLTFLDPYAPTEQYSQAYGINPDWTGVNWAENYSSRDATGGLTYLELPRARNVDVSTFGNTHRGPVEFYIDTIKDPNNLAWENYGFQRSLESGGWPASTSGSYPLGNYWEVLGGGPPAELGLSSFRIDSAQDVDNVPHAKSDAVQVSGSAIDIPTFSPAWISMLLDVTDPVNFITFDVEFLSEVGAEGLLAMYWDGEVVSTIDERYTLSGNNSYTMWLSGIMEPGTYELAFRLDPFTGVQSRVLLDNIQTGFAVVPEPSSLALCAICGLLFANRSRKAGLGRVQL